MKTADQIISHILVKPQFQKISKKRCFDKVVKLLPPHLARAVLFTYEKNQTLFIALNHPGFKMEFHYKESLIKSLLKQIKTIDPNCHDMQDIHTIKTFVSHQKPQKETPKEAYTYKERAKGEFEILCKDGKLRELFEMVREVVKRNHTF